MQRVTKWTALVGALALTTLGLGVAAQPALAEPGAAANVALASAGATVTASGREVATQWGPEKLIDGVVNPEAAGGEQSRWSSNYADDAWAAVTFPQAHTLHHVNVYWEAACAPTFSILGSTDGTTFDQLIVDHATQTCPSANQAPKSTYTVPDALKNTQFKAVKLQAHSRQQIGGSFWGVSAWEFEAWTGAETTTPDPVVANPVKIVPLPVSVTVTEGAEPFTLSSEAKIVAAGDAHASGEFLATILRASTGYDVPVVESATGDGNITLSTGAVSGQNGDEGYSVTVAKSGIQAVGSSDHGVFNAVQTIRQLFPAFVESKHVVQNPWVAPAVQISDSPRYSYRSVQLDPARSFVTVDEVKKILDTMAAYKLSNLHWHLADDQGWRIEITNDGRVEGDDIDYTLLTKVSGETAMNNSHGQLGQTELGRTGFYTQADYREIVAYAAARHINVVPEIDVPGHTNAALHAIAQLNTPGSSHAGTPDQPTAPANGTGNVGYSYLDPDSEVTFTFVRHVFTQLAAMTPGQFMHLGGDESHDFVARYGHDRYNRMLDRLFSIVRDTGKTPIGWNEVAQTAMKPGDTIQYWYPNSGDPARIKSAVETMGAKLVMSRADLGSYIDQKYNSKTPIGLPWARTGDFDVFYSWNPLAASGVTEGAIRGVEASMWSEAIRGGDQVEFMAFTRSIAIAEMGWTPQAQRTAAGIKDRMAYQGQRLVVRHTNFFDGATATWQASLAGTNSTAKPGNEATFNVGLLAAPGTLATNNAISTDTRNDAVNTPSASVVTAGSTVRVNWGDGSAESSATVSTNLPRSAFNASGLYYLTGSHTYAEAGTYTGTLTFDGRTAPFTVTVGATQADPTLLQPTWDSSATPKVSVERAVVNAGDRNPLTASGFEPNVFADIFLGDTKIGQLRPDWDGNREFAFQVPPTTAPGVYTLKVKQGDRVATTTFIVYSDAPSLPHPIPQAQLSIAGFSSQATNETAPNGLATAVIDGDPATFWHSQWAAPVAQPPHWLSIKLPSACDVLGLEYTPRQNNVNGRAKDYNVFVSTDGESWGSPVASGTFPDTVTPKVVLFTASNGAYVKFEIVNNQAGNAFATAGEVRIGGLCNDAQPATVTATAKSGSISASELTPSATALEVQPGEMVTLAGSELPSDVAVTVWNTATGELVGVVTPVDGAFTQAFKVPDNAAEGDLVWRLSQPGMGNIELPLKVVAVQPSTEPSTTPSTSTEPGTTPSATMTPTSSASPTQTASPTVVPTTPGVSVKLDKGSARVGGQVTVMGSGYGARESVRIMLHSDPVLLTNVMTDASGSFTATITVPAVDAGAHQVVATGSTSKRVASAPLTVLAKDGSLPNTGSSSTLPAVLGALLLLAGAGLVLKRCLA